MPCSMIGSTTGGGSKSTVTLTRIRSAKKLSNPQGFSVGKGPGQAGLIALLGRTRIAHCPELFSTSAPCSLAAPSLNKAARGSLRPLLNPQSPPCLSLTYGRVSASSTVAHNQLLPNTTPRFSTTNSLTQSLSIASTSRPGVSSTMAHNQWLLALPQFHPLLPSHSFTCSHSFSHSLSHSHTHLTAEASGGPMPPLSPEIELQHLHGSKHPTPPLSPHGRVCPARWHTACVTSSLPSAGCQGSACGTRWDPRSGQTCAKV
jgi:hypothetical protein